MKWRMQVLVCNAVLDPNTNSGAFLIKVVLSIIGLFLRNCTRIALTWAVCKLCLKTQSNAKWVICEKWIKDLRNKLSDCTLLLELHERRERAHAEALDLRAQHCDLLRLLLREFDEAPPLDDLLVAARPSIQLAQFRRYIWDSAFVCLPIHLNWVCDQTRPISVINDQWLLNNRCVGTRMNGVYAICTIYRVHVSYMLTVDLVDVVPLGAQDVELFGVQAEALVVCLFQAHVVLDVAQLALEFFYAALLVLQHWEFITLSSIDPARNIKRKSVDKDN